MISSPFTRTISTAENLIKGLNSNLKENDGKININTDIDINIDYGLYEFINGKHFKEHPENDLNLNKSEYDFLIPLKEINKENKPNFPEKLTECVIRYENCIRKLLKDFKESEEDVLLLVTHGYGVQVISDFLRGDYYEDDVVYIDYCFCFVFRIVKDYSEFMEIIQP